MSSACLDCRQVGHRQLMCTDDTHRHHVRHAFMGPVLYATWWCALLAFLVTVL